MNEETLLQRGFTVVPNYVLGQIFTLDVGRNRGLSVCGIGTPNEMVYLDQRNGKTITDCICVHNYDYDGFFTVDKLDALISILVSKKPKITSGQITEVG